MRQLVSMLALCLALTACTPSAEEGDDGSAVETPVPVDTAVDDTGEAGNEGAPPDLVDTAEGDDFAVEEETGDYLFEYAWPGVATRLPELATLLDRRLQRTKGELAQESAQARQDARDNGFPYNKHSYSAEWKVVADTPQWLSLSSEFSSYSGGAHGIYGVESLVWDKEGNRALKGIELFTSPTALEEALGTRLCDDLNRQREKRRGEPVEPGDEAGFNDCPTIDELEVLVGSTNRRSFNRLTLYAGPYVAGPYAEGAYEINLPVDQAVLAVVDPQYRESFTARN